MGVFLYCRSPEGMQSTSPQAHTISGMVVECGAYELGLSSSPGVAGFLGQSFLGGGARVPWVTRAVGTWRDAPGGALAGGRGKR